MEDKLISTNLFCDASVSKSTLMQQHHKMNIDPDVIRSYGIIYKNVDIFMLLCGEFVKYTYIALCNGVRIVIAHI
jgi:hypothetical protein